MPILTVVSYLFDLGSSISLFTPLGFDSSVSNIFPDRLIFLIVTKIVVGVTTHNFLGIILADRM